jgi:hypothetical protein
MNKIIIQNQQEVIKIAKIGKQKIEMQNFIPINDTLLICDTCLKHFISGSGDKFMTFPIVHIIFDMCIAELCTNVNVAGVDVQETENEKILNFDAKINQIEMFENSGLSIILKNNITNYDLVWEMIYDAIQLANVNYALELIRNTIPSEKDMEKTLSETTEMISQLNKDNPKAFSDMIKVASENNAYAKGNEDFTEKQKEEKRKKIIKNVVKLSNKRQSVKESIIVAKNEITDKDVKQQKSK